MGVMSTYREKVIGEQVFKCISAKPLVDAFLRLCRFHAEHNCDQSACCCQTDRGVHVADKYGSGSQDIPDLP